MLSYGDTKSSLAVELSMGEHFTAILEYCLFGSFILRIFPENGLLSDLSIFLQIVVYDLPVYF